MRELDSITSMGQELSAMLIKMVDGKVAEMRVSLDARINSLETKVAELTATFENNPDQPQWTEIPES